MSLCCSNGCRRRLASGAPLEAGERASRPPLAAFESLRQGADGRERRRRRATFLEEAIKGHPDYDRAYLALWECPARPGRPRRGTGGRPQRSRAASPLARRASFLAGVSLLELEQYDEAFEAFTAAAGRGAADRLPPRRLNNLGVVQLRRGGRHPQQGAARPTSSPRRPTRTPGIPNSVQPRLRLRARAELQGRALLAARGAAPRSDRRRGALRARRGAAGEPAAPVEAARERSWRGSCRRSSRTGEARASEKLAVPWGMERLREDPRESGPALRPEQTIVNTRAAGAAGALTSFHLDSGRRLFEREEDREALPSCAAPSTCRPTKPRRTC